MRTALQLFTLSWLYYLTVALRVAFLLQSCIAGTSAIISMQHSDSPNYGEVALKNVSSIVLYPIAAKKITGRRQLTYYICCKIP